MIYGITPLSLLGPKAEDLGQVDCQIQARLAICAQCLVALFPGVAPFPPQEVTLLSSVKTNPP